MLNWLAPVFKNNVAAKTQLAEGAKGSKQLGSKKNPSQLPTPRGEKNEV